MTEPKTLYDEDFVAWAEQQAAALRAAARGGSNQQLDWENLAEEIEDLGKSQRAARPQPHHRGSSSTWSSCEHSPAVEPRHGWRRTIRLARVQIRRASARTVRA